MTRMEPTLPSVGLFNAWFLYSFRSQNPNFSSGLSGLFSYSRAIPYAKVLQIMKINPPCARGWEE